MRERRQIVEAAGRLRHGDVGVLVTLVHIEGSSYRRTGARLLTHPDASARVAGAVLSGAGSYTGTISGGCLEAEVVRKAGWKVRDGAVVELYSTLFDDTAEIPYGLGCGGTVGLLFEPTRTAEFDALLDAMARSLRGEEFTVITWLPGESAAAFPGGTAFARAVLRGDDSVAFASTGVDAARIDAARIDAAMAARSHWDRRAGGTYVEHLLPPQRLVVLGAGDDAKPVVRMAALLGWSVAVVDGRAQFARAERFPEADRVLVASASEAGPLHLSPADAVILMTHSYEQDREWLAALLPIAPRYLGLLGAKHRSSLLVCEASAMTGMPLTACCERIYAPVGLDLGGDGPEAIALAVIAEAHARCNGRLGRSLRLSAEDVTTQVGQGGATRYSQAQCAAGAEPAGARPEAAAGP